MAYRSYSTRESVYLSAEEAELIKLALHLLMKNKILAGDNSEKDTICELVAEMNRCICENQEREAGKEAYPVTHSLEELLDEA